MNIFMAYIDAGTGSIILQASLAGAFATAFFFRQLKTWCRTQLFRDKAKSQYLSDK